MQDRNSTPFTQSQKNSFHIRSVRAYIGAFKTCARAGKRCPSIDTFAQGMINMCYANTSKNIATRLSNYLKKQISASAGQESMISKCVIDDIEAILFNQLLLDINENLQPLKVPFLYNKVTSYMSKEFRIKSNSGNGSATTGVNFDTTKISSSFECLPFMAYVAGIIECSRIKNGYCPMPNAMADGIYEYAFINENKSKEQQDTIKQELVDLIKTTMASMPPADQMGGTLMNKLKRVACGVLMACMWIASFITVPFWVKHPWEESVLDANRKLWHYTVTGEWGLRLFTPPTYIKPFNDKVRSDVVLERYCTQLMP